MEIEILQYDPTWMLEQTFTVGIPTKEKLTDQDIINRILEIQRTLRGAGIDVRCGLNEIMALDELEENFQESANNLEKNVNSFFSFTSTWKGVDINANACFSNGMCALTFFRNNEEDYDEDAEFCYEWYRLERIGKERVWVKYIFHDGVPLENLYSFLDDTLSFADMILPDSSEEGETIEDESQSKEEYEFIALSDVDEKFSWDELKHAYAALNNIDSFLQDMYERQVTPFLNIEEQLTELFTTSMTNTNHLSEVSYDGSSIKSFGLPQNFNRQWSLINMMICESKNGDKIVGVVTRNT